MSGLRLRLDEVFAAPRLAHEVARLLDGRYWVSDWTRQNAQFFRALRIEKTAMFIILTLIVAVAAFNLVSTLVMVVNDKRAEIAILRTLGLSPASVLAIFLIQGLLIGLVGTAAGAGGGIALSAHLETIVPAIERLIGPEVPVARDLLPRRRPRGRPPGRRHRDHDRRLRHERAGDPLSRLARSAYPAGRGAPA